jgi:hypothetical protein
VTYRPSVGGGARECSTVINTAVPHLAGVALKNWIG